MEKNLIVSAITFVLGAIYTMSDTAGITANVIGYSGPDAGLTSIMGIVLIIASGAFFVLTLENQVQHEHVARSHSKHDDEVDNAVYVNDLREKHKTEEIKG